MLRFRASTAERRYGWIALNPPRLVRLPLAGSFLLLAIMLYACQMPLRSGVTVANETQETFDAMWERRIAGPLEGRP